MFTKPELKAIKFAVQSDIETLQNMIDANQADARNMSELVVLNSVFTKINKML